ncbi:hypothetical protein K431DRAFT_320591 [Polychaeton citri CBS 116435]|uniref:DUF788-domain-containing protein n=1 Tax=Polychaeton citri CBS 116435 TaxID=1314669 RepID=A0A9P4Q5T1_9PEZI|nr:hypothetical protein K431DRAFT_320591 [Polychaeton citri CBS 116435]
MAQKALKTLAQKNAQTLQRTHLISLGINLLFLLLSLIFRFNRSFYKYLAFNAPALVIEFWFERIARPTYTSDGELRKAGEDLEAKGLTEWMWDVLYWSWACLVLVSLGGDWAWWLWGLVPVYSAYLAFATFKGLGGGMGGLMPGMGGGQEEGGQQQPGGTSKRQAKMEKRGGQKMVYR